MTERAGKHEFIIGDATSLPLEDESVHAIVTDPPYNFKGGFMSKEWDDLGDSKQYQRWCEVWGKEGLRILKPGGHILAFSGSHSFHRLISGIEDSGFEVRDSLMWIHGEGFPKSHNISKAIDKNLGVEDQREVISEDIESSGYKSVQREGEKQGHRPRMYYDEDEPDVIKRTLPASDIGKKFAGFGTALKPAFEPIVLARKPLEEDTIAEQVMETGTGGLNIDETRVELIKGESPSGSGNPSEGSVEGWGNGGEGFETPEEGRHPANVVLDTESAALLDEGNRGFSAKSSHHHGSYGENSVFFDGESHPGNQYSDSGGPSRFFYTSKARKSERTADGKIENPHPTVKPVDLMEWLVKLVSAEGQTVLDPFVGSGTTLIACENTHRRGIGVDKNPDYLDISEKRVAAERGRLNANSIKDW